MASLDSSGAAIAASPSFDVDRVVLRMREMSVDQLRGTFVEVFGEPTNSRHKDWLIKRIAWRMQANIYGGLSERALARAMELAKNADVRTTAPRKPKPVATDHTKTVGVSLATNERIPLPGSSLCREYKGRKILVRVLQDGFEFEGQIYKSLTAIAKAITGSHWNGYHFFGLISKEAKS